jgi:transposase-like protein
MSDPSRPFIPPHCPRTDCRFHTCGLGWRWVRYGCFTRRCPPRVIQRFRCRHCRITFSSQTFAATYYLKRPELLEPIGHRLLAGSGLRQITREARCAHSTAMSQAARLGRHALLALAAHRPPDPVGEPLVIDGFESFAHSQYQPLHLHLVVGAESHFVYGFTCSTLRRKGRMTARQRARRHQLEARHGRPDPHAVEHDMAVALRLAAPLPQALTVRSDEHPAYPRAFRHLPGYRIRHERTPSVAARTPGNPLFPVNLLDLLLRHNSANHKRETIAFSKRHQAVIERAALLFWWRNEGKPFSENHGGGTPAMRLGLRPGPRSVGMLLRERYFRTRVGLPAAWDPYYRRAVDTVGIAHPRRHALRRAF